MTSRLRSLPCFLALAASPGCMAAPDAHDALASTPATLAQQEGDPGVTPAPEDVQVTATGEGCGEFAFAVATYRSSYTALLGDVEQNQDRFSSGFGSVDCTLKVHYAFPAGWTFDAPATIVRGFANTDPSSRAVLTVRSDIGQGTATATSSFSPSTFDDFMVNIDEATALALEGSVPCGATSADIEVRVRASTRGRGTALTTLDSIDGKLTWRRCD